MTAQRYDLCIMRGTEESPKFMLWVVAVLRKSFLEEVMPQWRSERWIRINKAKEIEEGQGQRPAHVKPQRRERDHGNFCRNKCSSAWVGYRMNGAGTRHITGRSAKARVRPNMQVQLPSIQSSLSMRFTCLDFHFRKDLILSDEKKSN